MSRQRGRISNILTLSVVAMMAGTTAAQSQLKEALDGALGEDGASMFEGLGSQTIPSLGDVGTGNIAGLLEFCAKNNLLGSDASDLKDRLLGQIGGQEEANADPGYREGLGGILGSDSGQKLEAEPERRRLQEATHREGL
ncbi:MAG TPA: DUF2501 domain-containing protein [Geminicoccus sp.]|jgi:hypothetical protein|nr:DUF2501 domain-containing protein [Geminicoccus sp.]HEX2527227.1 DUF2501 domain-containing protein [Geminicoccus sp.]